MKRFIIFFLFVGTSVFCKDLHKGSDGSYLQSHRVKRMYEEDYVHNGEEVNIAEAPFVVQLVKNGSKNGFVCTGTLIALDTVICGSDCMYVYSSLNLF